MTNQTVLWAGHCVLNMFILINNLTEISLTLMSQINADYRPWWSINIVIFEDQLLSPRTCISCHCSCLKPQNLNSRKLSLFSCTVTSWCFFAVRTFTLSVTSCCSRTEAFSAAGEMWARDHHSSQLMAAEGTGSNKAATEAQQQGWRKACRWEIKHTVRTSGYQRSPSLF